MIISGEPQAGKANRRFLIWIALLTLFAWLLREYFVLVTVVEAPIRGDVRQYFAYAWNLLHHGTFSHVWPGATTPAPDTFRGPGYPAFLMLWMWIGGGNWYQFSLHAQAALGALTTTAAALLARHWLARPWALFAGAMVAIWPHHIAATGALLTEVVFGFLLTLALLLAAEAIKRRSTGWAAASGSVFSAAALTSTISVLFPIFAAALCWRKRMSRAGAALLIFALVGPAVWGVRDMTVKQVPGAPGRVTMNLVQGSWPLYHRAYASRNASPIARDIMHAIEGEERLLASDPRAGIAKIAGRMALDPGYYVYWYFFEKPFLLWDWDIRMGAGDVYFHRLSHSPLEKNPALHAIKRILKSSNAMIFVLSALASLAIFSVWLRGSGKVAPAAVLTAAFCIYATVVHDVFQAEPRYSIAYRPMQMLMLATALYWIAKAGTGMLSRYGSSGKHATDDTLAGSGHTSTD